MTLLQVRGYRLRVTVILFELSPGFTGGRA